MRLKSLKLAGFKSFANPTTFSFAKNITAIVGPNGCGKSNVIDAIRWVLGETSAKQLRGGAMSDVIFAGTQDKAAKSLASVELTFEHTQDEQTGIRHELNIYHELSVRRQVNKEGKSDYFINGTRCRRRDVVDIFLGTGLGARSYAVIEQGMIGRIVDSSPMQLREFIEEGAGVSRYQARRDETQKKLVKAEENLDRLNDLRSELEKQHKTLTRQAANAQQYQTMKDDLAKIEQELAVHQLYTAKQAEQTQKSAHNELNQSVITAQSELNQLTGKLDKLAERIAEQQWLKDDARDKLHQEQMKQQQAEHALNQQTGRIDQLADKQNNLAEQSKDNTDQIAILTEKQRSETQQLTSIAPKLAALQAQKKQLNAQLEPLNRHWQQIHAQREDLQNQQRTLEKQQALTEQATQRLAKERERLAQRQYNWQQAWDNMGDTNSIATLEQTLATHKNKLASGHRQSEDLLANIDEQQRKFNQLKAVLSDTQMGLQTQEKRHATLSSEYNTLHGLVFPKKKEAKEVKAAQESSLQQTTHQKFVEASVINSSSNLPKPRFTMPSLPKLSDNIELTNLGKTYADSLDNWLAMWLDVMVSSQPDTLFSLLTQSKPATDNNAILSAAMLSATMLSSSRSSATLVETTTEGVDESKFISINKLIKSPKLALWQTVYFYEVKGYDVNGYEEDDKSNENLNRLKDELANLPNGAIIVTNTGWLVGQFGLIHLSKLSGNNGDSHFLRQREQQKARLAELEDELNELEEQIEAKQAMLKKHQASHDELQIILEELTAQSSNLQTQMHEHRQAITELTAKFERHNADSERLKKEQQQLQQDQTQLETEEAEQAKQLTLVNQNLPSINSKLQQVETERSQIRYDRQQADNESREIDGQYQTVNLQEQQLKISLQHLDGQCINLQNQIKRFDKEQARLTEQVATLEAELPALQQAVKQQLSACHEGQVSLDEFGKQLAELQAQHTDERAIINDKQAKFAVQQQQLAELTTTLAIAKERVAEASSRVDSLVEQLGTGVSSSSLLADFIAHGKKMSEEKQTAKQKALQTEFQTLQMQLSRMGAVNLAAMEELEQVNERLSPLTKQTEDILASIEKLTDAITTIDGKTKALFMTTLNSVNDDLARLFAKVFGGGQASLTLIENDNLSKADKWRAGLELMAQPKGKKNSRLAVLSGGEKTLTALSLIFAIFKQHPAPFCVLDEVDAPLDDANVERFTGLIEEMATDLQFIFISHNKLSMQIADELKGITMPNAGVSSLVSVSLDEAEQYVEA